MNERIKLLAEQAVLDSLFESIDPAFSVGTGNGKMTIPLVFAEKFAELIVQECLIQVDKVDDMLDDDKDKEKTGVAWVGLAIAKHFGVE